MVFEYEDDVQVWAAEDRPNGLKNHLLVVVGTVKIAVEIDLRKAMAARASVGDASARASVEQMAQVNLKLRDLPAALRARVHLALQKAVEVTNDQVNTPDRGSAFLYSIGKF